MYITFFHSSLQTRMPPLKYTSVLLNQCVERDGAKLIGNYEKTNRETPIDYVCRCGSKYCKKLQYIIDGSGALCRSCGIKHMVERQKATMKSVYGVEHALQNRTSQEKRKQTMVGKYGAEHAGQVEQFKEKTRQTNQKRRGVDYPTQSGSVKEKVKESNRKNLGVDWPTQSGLVKKRVAQTNVELYGNQCSLQGTKIKEKVKSSMISRFGVEFPGQCEEIKEKMKATSLIRYGVPNPAQSLEIQEKTEKNAKRYKVFNMPSGEVRKVQGYEPFALRDLLKSYTEDQIITGRKNIPNIKYEVDGKKKVHFPDIFIPHENKIIEVKSTWTYKCKADNVLLKKKAAESQGYTYEIWCYDKKGVRATV